MEPRRILAVDYGLARVGLARTDDTGTLAVPCGILERTGDRTLANVIGRRFRELGAKEIVVGVPLRDDDRSTPVIDGAKRLAALLEKKCGVPVRLVDESNSSADAEAAARAAGLSRAAVAVRLDELAAAEILRRYLEEGV
jgi:putative holliday junction resolvase